MVKETLPISAKAFFASRYLQEHDKNILLLCESEESAIKAYKQILFFSPNEEALYFPSFDNTPYDRASPSQKVLSERATILSRLANYKNKKIIITNAANLLIKLPSESIFRESAFKISKKMSLSIIQLSHFLVKSGFIRSQIAIDSGEFAMRGEIIDVVISGSKAYRINFSWEQVESIKEYDTDSQISGQELQEIIINLTSEVTLNEKTINNFRNNFLRIFGVNYINEPVYKSVIEGRKFPNYENLAPLFYGEHNMLTNYIENHIIIYDYLSLQSIIEQEYCYKDCYQSKVQSNKIFNNNLHAIVPPEEICFSSQKVQETIENNDNILIHPGNSEDIGLIVDNNIFSTQANITKNPIKTITHTTIISYSSKSRLEKLKNIIENNNYKFVEINKLEDAKSQEKIIYLCPIDLVQSFYNERYNFISDQDILGKFVENSKYPNYVGQNSKQKLKNILIELDNLVNGDLVVHKEHGIGQFITVETLEVCGKPHDCLKILYADNDKLYIPVENIGSIKKYGSNDAALDKLGNLSWQRRKSKIKNRINSIAEKILQIAAIRKLSVTPPVEIDRSNYDAFCRRFPYTETEDQLNAIQDIIKDLSSGNLMDRLICGDVGFGKTEVAMRAAFIVASSSSYLKAPQIAIISPTTILCKQHYIRFQERFQNLGPRIAQLSRLVKPSEAKLVKEQIKNGEVNIIIGTHALLSKDVEFNNLKLLIIDEEQHFGVSQKESLKNLKSSTHVLSMSATPIPRTLQMSMVGLKDLSLITTPPLDRLPVHTTVMPFDENIIRDALINEYYRSGKSFYVVPRIADIPDIERKLAAIVPELKYKVVHGQMLPQIIDEIMIEFCDGKFDILLSTSIIESGIDISSANTMVIHKADMLGLSQLYQLRGRIGRGKTRAYAYLTLANNKVMTKDAIKRLEVMQNACMLGTGFTIASHDMDLRGFGNLVGEQQSGQIKEVGVELYQEMLDEQLAILNNKPIADQDSFMPTINLGLPVFIPDIYVPDATMKLGLYRRIGNLTNNDEIENFRDEMIDRFGAIPLELNNLLEIIKIKHICNNLHIEHLDSGENGFVLKFCQDVNVNDMIMRFINKYPRHTKIKPNNKLVFITALSQSNILASVNKLLEELSG
jgi:transcription-repair coupling factor (superfamily II helicase)